MLPDSQALFIPDSRAKVTVTAERRVKLQETPDTAAYPFVYELSTTANGGPRVQRVIAGTVDHVAFVVSCSESAEGWPWAEVAQIAATQEAKIREALARSREVG
jgi:hypothetical protein